ncbi:hypothetical protein EU803_08405 [Loktanella sp. IMCC34160]|uniref:hypothetical protein n=1 Tax=Loktanella sp. IMCC34160 TaxID=2510646 RepID=UPI00101C14DF|nr:hypothetical protein [Loktanella sp. IMCC34160]RYG91112.1 hypothetical protein EU803_08405 [Loktanella sp. IMCC34160]
MQRFPSAISLFAALSFGMPALAEVTADDVWTNMQAQTRAMGATLTAKQSRTGETVTVEAQTIAWTLPEGIGSLTLTAPGFAMVEQGDGTVQILYQATQTYRMDLVIEGDTATLDVRMDGATPHMTASGDPGDITYSVHVAGGMTAAVSTHAPGEAPVTIDVVVEGGEAEIQYRVTEGPLLAIAGQATSLPGRFDAEMQMGAEVAGTVFGTVGGAESSFELNLPSDGFDILNVAAALRAGLSLDLKSALESSDYTVNLDFYGQPFSEERRWSGANHAHFSLDENRLFYDASGVDAGIVMKGENEFDSPVDIAFEAAAASALLDIPVSGRDDPQPFALRFSFDGLRMGPGLWSLFDPAKAIPRDPASIDLDLSGMVRNRVDLLNFRQFVGDVSGLPEPELISLALSRFAMTGAGTATEATGAFTFDNTDIETFDGLPRPEGAATYEISGVEGLIDTLLSMGAIAQEDALGARLGLGMVTDSVGEDQYRGAVEINEQGHAIVNGQRMR